MSLEHWNVVTETLMLVFNVVVNKQTEMISIVNTKQQQ